MSELRLTKTILRAGIWHGHLAYSDKAEAPLPALRAMHLGEEIEAPAVTPSGTPAQWDVALVIPVEVVGDGVQTILLQDANSGKTLERISIAAGRVLDEDLRAEVDALRAELDILKRAFRRHCAETAL